MYALRKTKQLRGQPNIFTFRDFERFNETDFLNDITRVPWSIIECCDSVIGVNHPAIVREIPHFDVFPAFPHFC